LVYIFFSRTTKAAAAA